ncbi:MAG: hypothetical protein QXT45_07900 [Candidatus Bilamarchaeaceae archaeon]
MLDKSNLTASIHEIFTKAEEVFADIYAGKYVGDLRLKGMIQALSDSHAVIEGDMKEFQDITWSPLSLLDKAKALQMAWVKIMPAAPIQHNYSMFYSAALKCYRSILFKLLDKIIEEKQKLDAELWRSPHTMDALIAVGAVIWHALLEAHLNKDSEQTFAACIQSLLMQVFGLSEYNPANLSIVPLPRSLLSQLPAAFKELSLHEQYQYVVLGLKLFAYQSHRYLTEKSWHKIEAGHDLRAGAIMYFPMKDFEFNDLPDLAADDDSLNVIKMLSLPEICIGFAKIDSLIASNWIRSFVPLENIIFCAPVLAFYILPHTEVMLQYLLGGNMCVLYRPAIAMKVQSMDVHTGYYGLFYSESLHDYGQDLAKALGLPKALATMAIAMAGVHPSAAYGRDVEMKGPAAVQSSKTSFDIEAHREAIKKFPLPLQALTYVESSGGTQMEHALMTRGMHKGTRAMGSLGLMPIVAHEIVKNSPTLKQKYGNLLQYHPKERADKITEFIMSDPSIYHDIVTTHWNRLGNIFNHNIDKMVHAWHHGIQGTMKKKPQEIAASPYVQKFKFYFNNLVSKNRSSQPGLALTLQPPVKKSEWVSTRPLHSDRTYDFQLDPVVLEYQPQASDVAKRIQDYIRNGQVHHFVSSGKYSRKSYIVGDLNRRDDLWLIKVDILGQAPHIKLPGGSYSAREYAFYLCAQKFGIADHLPETYLGSWQESYGDQRQHMPAVAIRFLPPSVATMKDVRQSNESALQRVLSHWLTDGTLYKLGAVLYILGDFDSHSSNCMLNYDKFYIIDHGLSFVSGIKDEEVTQHDELHIPAFFDYFLDKGYEFVPKIASNEIKQSLTLWVMGAPIHELSSILISLGMEDAIRFCYRRWKYLLSIMQKKPIDEAILKVWQELHEGYWAGVGEDEYVNRKTY